MKQPARKKPDAIAADPDEAEQRGTIREFRSAVNMPPAALRAWLASDESRSVGMTPEGEKVTSPGGKEAVGHQMGGRILELLGKKNAEFDSADYAAMRKVIGYVHRHSKQRPAGDVTDTRWRKSLMNWGHDPSR